MAKIISSIVNAKYTILSSVGGGVTVLLPFEWILKMGYWNDNGIWDDTALWID